MSHLAFVGDDDSVNGERMTSNEVSHPVQTINDSLDDAMTNHMGSGMAQIVFALILGLSNAADAAEVVAVGYIIDVFHTEGHISKSTEGSLAAAVFVGMLVGGLLTGFFGDRFGRKRVLIMAVATNAIAGALSAAAYSTWLLIFFRVIGGIGIGGSMPPTWALAVELLAPRHRGKAIIWVAFNWVVGSLYAAGLAWVFLGVYGYSWRVFVLLASVPPFVCAILAMLILPESPHFLARHGAPAEAIAIVARIAHMNNAVPPLGQPGSGDVALLADAGAANANRVADGTHYKIPFFGGKTARYTSVSISALRSAPPNDGMGYDARVPGTRAEGTALLDEMRTIAPWVDAFITRWCLPHAVAAGGAAAAAAGANGGKGGVLIGDDSRYLLAGGSSSDHAADGPALVDESVTCAAQWDSVVAKLREIYSSEHRRNMFALQVVWFALAFSTYGVGVWIPTIYDKTGFAASKYANTFIFNSSQLPASFVCYFLIDHPKVGRRGLLLVSSVLSTAFVIIFASEHSTAAMAVTMSSLYQFAVNTSWVALDALATETFPVHLRTSAFSVQSAAGRVGAIIGQVLFAKLIDDHVALLLTICGIVLALPILSVLFLRKPKHEISHTQA